MIRETSVSVNDLVYPVFIKEGTDEKIPVDSMPGIYQYTIDRFPEELDRIQKAGVSAILIFGTKMSAEVRLMRKMALHSAPSVRSKSGHRIFW